MLEILKHLMHENAWIVVKDHDGTNVAVGDRIRNLHTSFDQAIELTYRSEFVYLFEVERIELEFDDPPVRYNNEYTTPELTKATIWLRQKGDANGNCNNRRAHAGSLRDRT